MVFDVIVMPSVGLKVNMLVTVQLFVTPWTIVCQAPPSVGFSRQESWSGEDVIPKPKPADGYK